MNEDQLFFIFFSVWIAYGIGTWAFMRRLSVSDRRKWHPKLVIATGVLFASFALAFPLLTGTVWQTRVLAVTYVVIVLASVALLSWLNIKLTKFCDSCGATAVNSNWFQKFEFCSKCGTRLN